MSPFPKQRPDTLLEMTDDRLRAACDLHAFRGSGPGGQKRNKTSSAVRLVHRATGLTACAEEDRSQAVNLRRALRRLRLQIAFHLRADPTAPAIPFATPTSRHPGFAAQVACVFDWLEANGWSIRDAADAMGVSGGRLSNWLCADPELLNEVNRRRIARGLRPLRPRG